MTPAKIMVGETVARKGWLVWLLRDMNDFPVAVLPERDDAMALAERLAGATGWTVEEEERR